ncbi:MAG: hypothetical protein IJI46_09430 [Erysipelotrichaceae bacterium]|nr:hypothetical protein [Erysipelotrichaceae bacterium]
MAKTLYLIRDILMYAGCVIGISMIGYVRVHFSNRQKKTPNTPLDYNQMELRLRKTAIVILAITIVLAMIPANLG